MGFSRLRVRYSYNLTGFMCCVYSVSNLKSYSDSPIYVCFKRSRYTCTEIYLQLFHFVLQQIIQFVVFHLSIKPHSTYHTDFGSIAFLYLLTQVFTADKYINNFSKSSITNTKQTLKEAGISEVGQSL